MALITKEKLRGYANERLSQYNYRHDSKYILSKDNVTAEFSESRGHNIFLCHSSLDSDTILGLTGYFASFQLTTYVDWIDDPQLNRSKVDRKTADLLRKRMQNSNCLLYASSDNSANSKWMPWECGYFDGIKSKVAICPISESTTQSQSNQYNGLEYLDLYPYLATNGLLKETLRIHESPYKYVEFEEWLKGQKPKAHLNR